MDILTSFQNETPTIRITLVILLTLLAFVIFRSAVIQHSLAVVKAKEALADVQSKKPFNLTKRICLNSKTQYDNFSRDRAAGYLVAAINEIQSKIEQNTNIYNDANQILSEAEALSKKCLFKKGAMEYVQNIRKNIERLCPVHYAIVYSYMSPAGRNSYMSDYRFGLNDVQDISAQIVAIETYRQTKQYQRSLLSKKLRYQILKRDHYHCVICGRGEEDGARLHVDHIIPVSKGGKTIPSNLRTLCEECNLGKSDDYDESYDYKLGNFVPEGPLDEQELSSIEEKEN